MSDIESNWMMLARIASQHLGRSKRDQRAVVLAQVAKETQQSVNTVRRAIAASDYAQTLAALYGVLPGAIVAPISTIETLKRIDKIAPEVASVHTRAALQGKIGYGSLLAICKTLEMQARDEAKIRKPIDARALASLVKADLGHSSQYNETIKRSFFATAFRVDLEMTNEKEEECRNIVAVLSPNLKPPASRSTMEAACGTILAASLVFERTYYVASSPDDQKKMLNRMSETRIDQDRMKILLVE